MKLFRNNKLFIALTFSGFILISSALPLYSFPQLSQSSIRTEKSDSIKTDSEKEKVMITKPEEKKNEYKKPETSTKKIVYNIIFYLISTFIKENPQILPR